MESKELDNLTKQKIINLLKALFPQVKIYLYGSRARGTNRPRSDIDLAIDTGQKSPRLDVEEAKSVLEGTFIPYKIDLVDLNGVSEEFRNLILQEGVVWYQSDLINT